VNLTKIGLDGVEWIQLAQDWDRWGFCEHGNEPSAFIKGVDFLQ
jgi:hypothetical protein